MKARLAVAIVTLLAATLAAQSPALSEAQRAKPNGPRELFERARMLEESNTRLRDAIELYVQVAAQSHDRQLAATAHLRAGLLYERLGQAADAQRAFKLVVDRYPDQMHVARDAKMRLSSNGTGAAAAAAVRKLGTFDSPFIQVSADGRRLLHQDPESRHLFVTDLSAGTTRAVVPEWTDSHFLWSPDGAEIVFWTRERGACRLERASIDGRRRTVLLREPAPLELYDWSPHSNRLLVGRPAAGRREIAWVDLRDASRTAIFSTAWAAGGFQVSPDVGSVAYAAEANGNWDIHVRRLDRAGDEIRVTEHPAADTNPYWSPDGRELFFQSHRMRAGDIWTARISPKGTPESAARLVWSLGGRALSHAMTGGGDLVFSRRKRLPQVALLRIEPGTSDVRLVDQAPLAEQSREPFWSPDGTKLYFRTDPAGGAPPLAIERDLGSGFERVFPMPPAIAVRSVGPSGHHGALLVLGAAPPASRVDLYRYDLSQGTAALVAPLGAAFGRPALSPKGDLVLFSSPRADGRADVRLLDTSTGAVREAAVASTNPFPQWSPAGDEIAYSDGPCLMLVPVTGGPARRLTCAPPADPPRFRFVGAGGLSWSPDARRLAWTVHNGDARRIDLWIVDRRNGEHTLWPGEADYRSWPRDPSWSPDGRQIAIGIDYRPEHEVWALTGVIRPQPRS
jgi:Tol biopolymer transport system component